jgi:hypothetical protein
VAGDESADLRWMNIDEMERAAGSGELLQDVLYIYQFMASHLETYVQVPASRFSVDKPQSVGLTYKRGAPGV